jgi:spoIIIJ-associated protein
MTTARVVETSGTDVEEATARALDQLGLSRDQVDVDVVREGKKGFLGLGAEEAIVRVTAKQGAQAATEQRGRRSRGGRGGRGRGRGGRGDDDRDGGRRAQSQRPAGGQASRPRGERTSRPQTGVSAPPTAVPGAPDELPTAPPADAEDEVDFAGRTLRDILTLLGLTSTEIGARDPDTPGDGLGLISQVFDIVGEDDDASEELGVLIGRRGETLSALQYLLNVTVSSRYDGDSIFSVDIDGYRRRREQSLVELAHRIANEVRASGDVITLEPMPPAERRIIHLELQEEQGVKTESVGSGSDRQVEIMPD